MQINKLILNNIRSYEEKIIEFNKGITLLTGDIGSGKSTILLAIEFALFGLIKGQLNSDSVLRHGSKSGNVVLEFTINNNNYVISRSLKRTNSSIKQESGYLSINRKKQELTPQELRAKVISLLGYPLEFVTKSPSILYRYTVYTPQETMKQILMDSIESRLETIRKIFNLDKYKIIRKNIDLYIKELKSKIRENIARIEDLDILKEELQKSESKLKSLEIQIKELNDLVNIEQEKYQKSKLSIDNLNEKIEVQRNLSKEIAVIKSKINSYNSEETSLEKQLISLAKSNDDIKEIKPEELDNLNKNLISLKQNKDVLLNRKKDFLQKRAILDSRLSDSQKKIDNISSLDICPTCKQNVTDSHKKSISEEELKKQKTINEKLNKIKEVSVVLDNKNKLFDEKINNLNEEITQIKIKQAQLKSLKEKLNLKSQIKSNIEKIKKQKISLDTQLKDLIKKIDTSILELHKTKTEELNNLRDSLKQKEVLLAETQKEKSLINLSQEKLQKEILKKEKLKLLITNNRKLQNWLENLFMQLMIKLEKHTLINIQREFNLYFQDWFNLLIEDENINVRLDDSFSPLIEQNGYETSIDNLSGGEKTSVALAYRLSLNHVINSFVSNIRTKELLILDEPTDGFSTQQLDRLRDVLLELKSNQIILVSHESKLESYADNIIKINKEHNVSSLSY